MQFTPYRPAASPASPRPSIAAARDALAEARAQFLDYVRDAAFPCVGAKSALNRRRYRFGRYGALGEADAEALCGDLHAFLDEFRSPGLDPVSFVALFDAAPTGEAGFEQALWQQLQRLHEVDRRTHRWDPSVSSDPADRHFSFSVGGRGLFVVGLHPNASRIARRSPQPTLVFNLHEQFEALRAAGKYDSMQRAVRRRDIALQGSVNPVLARFGEASEALQYSGRAVTSGWQCPFHRVDGDAALQ